MALSIRICPKCGSDDVQMIAGGTIGMWMCKKCGFSGSIFPEKPILGKEVDSENIKNEEIRGNAKIIGKKNRKIGGKK